MARPWDDCRFFVISQCRNSLCKFRHSEHAKTAEVCAEWEKGLCQNIQCPLKHVLVKDKSSILCHYERLPTGCTNPDCPFKHSKPRDTEAIDLQKKLAQFLAEHEKLKETKKSTSQNGSTPAPPEAEKEVERKVSSSSEEDLNLMRARILQQQVKIQSNGIVKKISQEPTKKKSPAKQQKIVRNLAQPQEVINKPQNLQRRIIQNVTRYSDDEGSDISLGELTDEEQEDLRATLNKSKDPKTSSANDFTTRIVNKDDTKKQPIRGRVISIRKKEDEDSRPSSSEWIERKITVKNPIAKGATKRTVSNRLISKVKSISRTVNSTSESEYSDTPSLDDSPRRKRKPNLSWVQKDTKESSSVRNRLGRTSKDLDNPEIIDRTLQDRLNRFNNDGIVKTVTKGVSKCDVKSRLGIESAIKASIKSRLGDTRSSDELSTGSRGVKGRLGEVRMLKSSRENKTERIQPEKQSEPVTDPVVPPKKKKLILIKKKKVEKPFLKDKPVAEISDKNEKSLPAVKQKSPKKSPPESNPEIQSPVVTSAQIEGKNDQAESKTPSKPTTTRIRRNSSPRVQRKSSTSTTGKSRKDTTIDELEAELLDDADLLDVDENIDDDDDLFNDL